VLELTVRVIASLAVVVGLMLLLARLAGRRLGGRPGAPVQVLHRQSLTRASSVAVVSVGSRILVLGTTDQQVRLLTELDPDDLDELPVVGGMELVTDDPTRLEIAPPQDAAAVVRRAGAHRAAPAARVEDGALAGSVLSPQTWRQALAVATGKAS
jgi:flagellar protein FliO/FliZ